MKEFINVLLPALASFLIVIIGYWTAKLKAQFDIKLDTEQKKSIVTTVVNAVEQLYKDLDGPAKLDSAKKYILDMLDEKGIEITELELDMYIESAVNEFNKFKVKEKLPDSAECSE